MQQANLDKMLKQKYSEFYLHGAWQKWLIDCTLKAALNKTKIDERWGLARPRM